MKPPSAFTVWACLRCPHSQMKALQHVRRWRGQTTQSERRHSTNGVVHTARDCLAIQSAGGRAVSFFALLFDPESVIVKVPFTLSARHRPGAGVCNDTFSFSTACVASRRLAEQQGSRCMGVRRAEAFDLAHYTWPKGFSASLCDALDDRDEGVLAGHALLAEGPRRRGQSHSRRISPQEALRRSGGEDPAPSAWSCGALEACAESQRVGEDTCGNSRRLPVLSGQCRWVG